MSEGTPKSPVYTENPLLAQVEELRAQERLKTFVDHTDNQSVQDFKETQDHLGQTPRIEEAEVEDPLNSGLFEGDVFYADGTQKVIAIVGSRRVGDVDMVQVATDNVAPNIRGGAHHAVREMTPAQAKAYIAASGATLLDAGHDRALGHSPYTTGTNNEAPVGPSGQSDGQPERAAGTPEAGAGTPVSPDEDTPISDIFNQAQQEARQQSEQGAEGEQAGGPTSAYLRQQLEEAARRIEARNAQANAGGAGTPEGADGALGESDEDTPISDIFNEAQQEERQRQLAETLAQIENEANAGELGEKYRAALAAYAELKADGETKGRWGRTKREKKLKSAEDTLREARLALEKDKVGRRTAAGLYEGNREEIMRHQSNDIFGGIRALDGETRHAVNTLLDERMENRNLFKKAAAAVGRFFTKGGKVSQWARGAGTGALAGFGVAITGAGIPITSIAGIGLGLSVRGAAAMANLDRIRAENKDEDGNAVTLMSDQYYTNLVRAMGQDGATNKETVDRIAREIFETSRARGYEQADRARRQANQTMGKFALGFAAGAAGGTLLHSAINHPAAHGQHPAKSANSAKSAAPSGGASGGHNALGLNHNLPPNANNVHLGEGFDEFFGHLGINQNQVAQMLGDHHLMEGLVHTGDAYPSNSAIVGPYGILMPKGGHFSAAGMQLIEAAMKAKGF